MPRAVRKSVISRCSSRSSSRSSYRKRQSPRDNVLNSIRDALRSSINANRYGPLRRESPSLTPTSASPLTSTLTPPLTPVPAPPMTQTSNTVAVIPPPETNVTEHIHEKTEKKNDKPKPVLTQTDLASNKPMGLFEHGIRYIMLPLHLFHLCVWGSPTAQSPEAKEKKTSPSKSKGNDKKSSRAENKNSTSSSKPSSSSNSSSTSSKSARVTPTKVSPSTSSSTSSEDKSIAPISSSAHPSSSTPSSSSSSVPTEKSSPSVRRNSMPRRILREEYTKYSSDEMVTANEDLDDSSNDQWSNAVSVPSMNMSIDFESYNNVEKISSTTSCAMEEPMDVSIEESNVCVKQSIPKSPSRSLRANVIKSTVEKKSETGSSSSSPEDRSIYRESPDSAVDREIASIFQRACTSSSSDDEDCGQSNGRKNYPFVNRSSNFGPIRCGSRFREEISDAAIRKKRTSPQYERLPEVRAKRINRSSSVSRSSELPVDMSKIKVSNDNQVKKISLEAIRTANQTDSAYSDEDVEMNSINESIIRLQSVHMQSLQETVVEWMDQDLDYVADTEDSNDGLTLPGRARIPSFGAASSASADQGFVERDCRQRDLRTPSGDWREMSGLEKSIKEKINLQGNRTPLRDLNKNAVLKESRLDRQSVRKEVRTPLEDWNKISGLEGSVINSRNVRKEVETPLGDWREMSGLEKSIKEKIDLQGNRTPLMDLNKNAVLKESRLDRQSVRKETRTPKKEVETSLGDWREMSGLEKSMKENIDLQGNRTPLRDTNKNSVLKKSKLDRQSVRKEVRTPLGDWNKISELDRSIKAQIPVPEETDDNLARWQKSCGMEKLKYDAQVPERNPPGFPAVPQYPAGTPCHCGNPNCFYVPLAVPAAASDVKWTRNYPKPPSPLRHLYYEYPEFMSPPAEASNIHQSPYVLIPVPANLVRQELA